MTYRINVLLVLDHAPDYRETFFRQLGSMTKLTVVAQPCEPEGLTAPLERKGYEYLEIPTKRVGGMYWQPGLRALTSLREWDVICMGINLRHTARIVTFISLPNTWKKWVWRGHIFGRAESETINFVRGWLLRRSAGCLAYSQIQSNEVVRRFGVNAVSFNNSEVRACEFRPGSHSLEDHVLKLLFVGRYQPRKRLERLIDLASRRSDIFIRLVGPDMDKIDVPQDLKETGRVQRFGKTSGDALNQHFDWADMVANPGHVGLLVMNAARHQKGIIIDSESRHAPEYWLAKQAEQPFVDFSDASAIDEFLDSVIAHPISARDWAVRLQELAKKEYTVEYMVEAHLDVFNKVYEYND